LPSGFELTILALEFNSISLLWVVGGDKDRV
jgi:hypothetical protein